jgi:hypothetical protein
LQLKINKINKHTKQKKLKKQLHRLVQHWSSQNLFILHIDDIFSRLMRLYFRIYFQDTLLNVLDTQHVCSFSGDINNMNCRLIRTVFLSYRKASPRHENMLGSCLLTLDGDVFPYASLGYPAHWLRPVITTNWFLFSEADDVSCFVSQNVETVRSWCGVFQSAKCLVLFLDFLMLWTGSACL